MSCTVAVGGRASLDAAKHSTSAAGPTMLFVTLHPRTAPKTDKTVPTDKLGWDKPAIEELSTKWQDVRYEPVLKDLSLLSCWCCRCCRCCRYRYRCRNSGSCSRSDLNCWFRSDSVALELRLCRKYTSSSSAGSACGSVVGGWDGVSSA